MGTASKIVFLAKGNETILTRELVSIPAITVGMNADLDSFMFYESGVFNDQTCNRTIINHGVTVVGYGTDPIGGDFYIVKNSWGTNWGEEGYVRMARNRGNLCGIASFASYPIA